MRPLLYDLSGYLRSKGHYGLAVDIFEVYDLLSLSEAPELVELICPMLRPLANGGGKKVSKLYIAQDVAFLFKRYKSQGVSDLLHRESEPPVPKIEVVPQEEQGQQQLGAPTVGRGTI